MAETPDDEAEHDAMVEMVWEDAENAAAQSSPFNPRPCPYPENDWRADVWRSAYGHHLMNNGWH